MKTHLYLDQLPGGRPSKRLRRISLALSHEMDGTGRLSFDQRALEPKHAPIRSARGVPLHRAATSSIQDIGVLLDSFLCDALNLEVLSPMDSMDDLPGRHKAFAFELEERSVRWRAWNTSCGVWLIGGVLDASRSERLGGAVVYLEWMSANGSIHRNWWCSFRVGEWIAGQGS